MTRPLAQLNLVKELLDAGLSDLAIFRQTGIPRRTVYDWRTKGRRSLGDGECPRCGIASLNGHAYAYLLGLYLGDGHLAKKNRNVYRLRFMLDDRYPGIQSECAAAIQAMRRRVASVCRSPRRRCTELSADWNHWICLFPQHGKGRKHQRSIQLHGWQSEIVMRQPGQLLRGLIHSDGCRYEYAQGARMAARYQFTNYSPQILEIFCLGCRCYGVGYTKSATKVSVSRKADVTELDAAIGPKE